MLKADLYPSAKVNKGDLWFSVTQATNEGLTPVSESSKYIIGYLGTVDLDDAALRKEVIKGADR